MSLRVGLLVLLLVLAGCASTPPPQEETATREGEAPSTKARPEADQPKAPAPRHEEEGEPGAATNETRQEVAPSVLRFRPPVDVDPERGTGEPMLAVAPDGTVWVEGPTGIPNRQLWKSTDDGRTFDRVTVHGPAGTLSGDSAVAVADSGRVIISNAWLPGFQVVVAFSDDAGASWLYGVVDQPASHRMWLDTGPGSEMHLAVDTLTAGSYYYHSTDGGLTWSLPVEVFPTPDWSAPLLVDDADRRVWPRYEGEWNGPGVWYAMVSDDGASWTRHEIASMPGGRSSVWAGGDVDDAGRYYVTWAEHNAYSSTVQLVWSHDGKIWNGPIAVAKGPQARAMPWVSATGDGDVALVWYHNDQFRGEAPTAATGDWHIHYAEVSVNATAAVQLEMRVFEEALHEGSICLEGPQCEGEEDRRLLDYPWIDHGPDGRAYLAVSFTQGLGRDGDGRAGVAVFVEERPPGSPSKGG